jgi:hypothetical protein
MAQIGQVIGRGVACALVPRDRGAALSDEKALFYKVAMQWLGILWDLGTVTPAHIMV